MPQLDQFNLTKFTERLDKCEQNIEALSRYNQGFVESMREKFDSRADAEDLGAEPWNPTIKQWNHLFDIAEGL